MLRTTCFICLLRLGFIHSICIASFIFKTNSEFAWSIILKQDLSPLHCALFFKWSNITDPLPTLRCSSIRTLSCLVVSPIYLALQPGQEKEYTTKDLCSGEIWSFNENKDPILNGEKLNLIFKFLQYLLVISEIPL